MKMKYDGKEIKKFWKTGVNVEDGSVHWKPNNSHETREDYSPRLNIAIPRPASESIEIDCLTIAGIPTFHLQFLVKK